MARTDNLKRGNPATQFRTGREQVEIARQGGKRSGEVRRENKLIKDRILERMGEGDWDLMIDKLIERATIDTKSFEVLRDTIGQKPKDQLEVDTTMEINVVLDDED